MRDSWVITAAGFVTAAGDDVASLVSDCEAGAAAGPTRPIRDFDPARYLTRKGLRHLSRTSQLAVAAAARVAPAVRDVPPAAVGVVLGSAWASLESIVRFEREAHTEGPRHVDPGLFAETVANVPAGHVSIVFGWSALNATLASGGASGIQAFASALELLDEGRAEVVVAGGADELNPQALRVFEASGSTIVGSEAACLVAIESSRHAAARGATPIGRLHAAIVSFSDPGEPSPAAPRLDLLRELIDRAGVDPAVIDLAVVSRGPCEDTVLREFFGSEPPRSLAPRDALGETWSAAAPLGLVLALASARAALVVESTASGHFGAMLVSRS